MTDYFDFTISEPSNPSFLGKKGIQYKGPKVMLDTVPVGNIFCGITANQSGPFNKIGTPPDTYYSNSNSKVRIFSSDENNLASWPAEGDVYSKQGIPSQKSVWVIMWPIRDIDGNIYTFAPNSYLYGIMVKKTPITWDSDDMSTWNVYLACVPDDDSSPCDYDVIGEVTDYNVMKNVANLYTCDNTNCGSDKKYKKCNYPPKQRYCIKPYYEKESDPPIEFGTAKFPCVPENASGCPDQIQDGGECKLKCPANFEGSGLISCNIPQDTFRDFGKASCNCKGPSPSPTPKPSPGPSPSPESRGLSTPAIIGISIGGVALVVGIGLVIMNLIKKKRKGRKK